MAFELVCEGAEVNKAAGFGVWSRERSAQERELRLCKGPGSIGRNWEKACVLELRAWRDEWQERRLGRGHPLDQTLVFILRAVGNL